MDNECDNIAYYIECLLMCAIYLSIYLSVHVSILGFFFLTSQIFYYLWQQLKTDCVGLNKFKSQKIDFHTVMKCTETNGYLERIRKIENVRFEKWMAIA